MFSLTLPQEGSGAEVTGLHKYAGIVTLGTSRQRRANFYDFAMSEFTKTLLIASIPRYLLIGVGTLFLMKAYRLFDRGYSEKSGEFSLTWKGLRIVLKQVAPGVFFALFGLLAIGIGFYRPIEINVAGSRAKMSYTIPKQPSDNTHPPDQTKPK